MTLHFAIPHYLQAHKEQMQHYAAEIHFLIQEALATALFHHSGQYQLDCEDPAAETNSINCQLFK